MEFTISKFSRILCLSLLLSCIFPYPGESIPACLITFRNFPSLCFRDSSKLLQAVTFSVNVHLSPFAADTGDDKRECGGYHVSSAYRIKHARDRLKLIDWSNIIPRCQSINVSNMPETLGQLNGYCPLKTFTSRSTFSISLGFFSKITFH